MFWGDTLIEQVKKDLSDEIKSGSPLIIRDEKTASGRVHVGSMRGVAIHGLVHELLADAGIKNQFLYEINDFDAFDTVPRGLPKEKFEQYLGKPLYAVPPPDLPAGQAGSKASNYAEYFGDEFKKVINEIGFNPDFYLSSESYKAGKYNEVIRCALEEAGHIREIYKKVSGSDKGKDWLPLMVVCEECGKIAVTRTVSFDGKCVHYACDMKVEGAEGCGHEGDISPYDGNAKLHFKVEWAAKFKVFGVHIEGSGKDLSTRGGARDVANHIAKEVFDYKPPFDIPYEFFLVGGKKMAASKGTGSSAREIADLMPPQIFRLALLGKNPKQAFNFDPSGDTLPVLFDLYDRLAKKYWDNVRDDDIRLFEAIHGMNEQKLLKKHFLPRFSHVAFLVQMPHMDLKEEIIKLKEGALTKGGERELEERSCYASHWLTNYASEDYRFLLQEEKIPPAAQTFTDIQKKALQKVLAYIEGEKELNGEELHGRLHEIRKEMNIPPTEFFSALYLSFLGKKSGPKAGWFLSVLDKEFLEKRLRDVTA